MSNPSEDVRRLAPPYIGRQMLIKVLKFRATCLDDAYAAGFVKQNYVSKNPIKNAFPKIKLMY
jgi:hypothetical protein